MQGTMLDTWDGPAVVVRDLGDSVEARWPNCNTPQEVYSVSKSDVTKAAKASPEPKQKKRKHANKRGKK
jgi:hypothetical protein